jgi:hypothetical protein
MRIRDRIELLAKSSGVGANILESTGSRLANTGGRASNDAREKDRCVGGNDARCPGMSHGRCV